MSGVVLYGDKVNIPKDVIQNPIIDGYFISKYEEGMLENNSQITVDHILINGYKTLSYMINPLLPIKKTTKILCLGKVQSGKTSFFISTIALAFDNGYNLVYVIGGTKTSLKDQNYERLVNDFRNNDKVKIIDINQKDHYDPLEMLNLGFKVIIVALKNISSASANLGKINQYSEELKDFPSIIIDDEGDECSPGAPKIKEKKGYGGKTHDIISEIISNVRLCTYLSVTATPQANFLLSTIDELSPDYALLVEPGDGYTGGNSFHDIFNNKHVISINDSDDFNSSTPDTFKNAFCFFIYDLLLENYKKNLRPYSMLVHPSSLTKVHSMVSEKIIDYFVILKKALLNPLSTSFDTFLTKIFEQKSEDDTIFSNYNEFKKAILPILDNVINQINIEVFNTTNVNSNDKFKYTVYVGGNMLGRGLTIKNLIVTYMYRDSKITNIDTLYQRARWFGYKKNYFNLCRVYMTNELKYKFISIVENENDMWNSIESFLLTKSNIKQFPRIFTLNGDNLRLTRTTISKTIQIERFNPGYNYDKSILLSKEDKENNTTLYNSFLKKYLSVGKDEQFGNSDIQHHLIIEMKFSDFLDQFLSKYKYPKGSNFGPYLFNNIQNQISNGVMDDKVYIIVMRYKTGEFRSPIANGFSIKELPQSYDNGTNYPGDKDLLSYAKKFHIQIHPVYIDKDKKEQIIPLLAMNNPISDFSIKYVTGDNYYG